MSVALDFRLAVVLAILTALMLVAGALPGLAAARDGADCVDNGEPCNDSSPPQQPDPDFEDCETEFSEEECSRPISGDDAGGVPAGCVRDSDGVVDCSEQVAADGEGGGGSTDGAGSADTSGEGAADDGVGGGAASGVERDAVTSSGAGADASNGSVSRTGGATSVGSVPLARTGFEVLPVGLWGVVLFGGGLVLLAFRARGTALSR